VVSPIVHASWNAELYPVFVIAEQSKILRMSSIVNGLRFHLWSEITPDSYSGAISSGSPYQYVDSACHSAGINTQHRDPEGQPPLSPDQIRVSSVWRRAIEAVPHAMVASPLLLPDAIVQHIVTDCSVCASFSVCLEHHRRFKSKVSYFLSKSLCCLCSCSTCSWVCLRYTLKTPQVFHVFLKVGDTNCAFCLMEAAAV
jgi:hypothetical protein